MAIDERRRLQLAEDAKRALGEESGITLMEMLPPVGWADVATRRDLDQLEGRLESRFEAALHTELSAWMWRSVGITAALFAALAALIKL